VVHFVDSVNGCRKTELMAVVLIGESYMTSFDQTPQTSCYETYILVELEHSIVLTPRECLEVMLDEPCKIIMGHRC